MFWISTKRLDSLYGYLGGGPSPQTMVLLLVHWQLQYAACCECTGCLSYVVAAGAWLCDVYLAYGEMAQ